MGFPFLINSGFVWGKGSEMERETFSHVKPRGQRVCVVSECVSVGMGRGKPRRRTATQKKAKNRSVIK